MFSSSPSPATTGQRALHVLVAEDNVINQKVAISMLRQLGHTGVLVEDGTKALRCMAQIKFDLILMDVMMPHMDGLQALAAIREQEKQGLPHMPIIMATSHDLPGDRERFLLQGADGYVAKPLNAGRLKDEIARVLRR